MYCSPSFSKNILTFSCLEFSQVIKMEIEALVVVNSRRKTQIFQTKHRQKIQLSYGNGNSQKTACKFCSGTACKVKPRTKIL
jgi:hypothetical protein